MRHTADTITDDELDALYERLDRLVSWVADLADMPEDWVWERLAEERQAAAECEPVGANGPQRPRESP
ncbi:hypothetical protein [Streptomyces xanthochromogenes]|uniref:hypothetical protein n=1 Tax=Streptomyces xanthochromogenes TaxID=67384 RepID=UPI002F3FEDA1